MSKDEQLMLKNYQDVLSEIGGQENHLLLGNGFNLSLGIKTDYSSIFEVMKSEYKGYREIENEFKESGNDIEKLIKKLEKGLKIGQDFLGNFINNKIKLDFMKAASHIASAQVKGVYKEKNEGIYLLFKNFNNYFTLNYDPFLYLLLMKFKKIDEKKESIIFQNTLPFIEDDLDSQQNQIHAKIKEARASGQLKISVNGINSIKDLRDSPKTEFIGAIKNHFKNESWTHRNIDLVVNLLLKEENQSFSGLDINDGFFSDKDFGEPIYEEKFAVNQNLYFLHGAFHIHQNKDTIYKITQTSDKALYSRLEEAINNEDVSIICVLCSDGKIKEIENNKYLNTAFRKLSELSGSIVMIGCSLSENDNHIFEQINQSTVERIYISSKEKGKYKDLEKAKKIFKNKQVILFDRETISYELPLPTND